MAAVFYRNQFTTIHPALQSAVRSLLRWLFTLFCLWCSAGAFAQQYPVTATVTVLPPQTTYLADYGGAGSNKMTVLLLNHDLAEPLLQVRLALRIEGNGIVLQTRPGASFAPISLQAGIPYMAGGADLNPYLSASALDFSGISYSNYEQSKSLPEGMYQLCVTVYDYTSGRRISELSCLPLYMTLFDPPLLNMPPDGFSQTALFPQQMIFNWSDLHVPQPGSAGTDYRFSLWEVPKGQVVADVVNSTRPLYTALTPVTLLSYGITEPMLDTGKSYVWRVQAVDRDGKACFKNNGWSQWSTFTYKAGLTTPGSTPPIVAAPGSLAHDRVSKSSGRGYWDTAFDGAYNGYRIQYRKSAGGSWFTLENATGEQVMSQLETRTAYEWRVQGKRSDGDGYGLYSTIDTFTTLGNVIAECGKDPAAVPPSAVPPLQQGYEGMVVHAGQWDIYVTRVSGGGGSYSGRGLVLVPYISKLAGTKSEALNTVAAAQLAKLPGNFVCEFDGVTIDQDFNLVAGEVRVVSSGINGSGMLDVDSYLEGGGGTGGIISGEAAADITVPGELADGGHATVGQPGSDGGIPVTVGGTTTTVKDMPATVKDASGDIFTVDTQGNINQVGTQGAPPVAAGADGNAGGSLNKLSNQGQVVFGASPGARFSFDAWQEAYSHNVDLSDEYPQLPVTGSSTPYYVPSQFTIAAKSDKVTATLTINNGLKADSIVFITGKGLKLKAVKKSSTAWEIPVIGSQANDGVEVFALYPAAAAPGDSSAAYTTLGKLQVVSYARKAVPVKIVPVGNALLTGITSSALKEAVNRIFDSVGVTIELSITSVFADNTWNNGLVVDGSGFFSTETADMKALQTTYEAQYGRSDTAVLFVVSSLKSADGSGGIRGDMPRGKRYGYLGSDLVTGVSGMAVTIVHELSHGVFRLEHTFSSHYNIPMHGLKENVMDYDNGAHFNKHQWDAINNPGLVIGVFEGDKGAQMISQITADNGTGVYSLTGRHSFITPSGNIITIDSLTEVRFVTSYQGKVPQGSLIGFKRTDGITYTAAYTLFTKFHYYVKAGNLKERYTDRSLPAEPVVYLGYPEKCAIKVYTISAASITPTRSDVLLSSLDYPGKQLLGTAPDPDACIRNREAQLYYSQCIDMSSTPGNAGKEDCYVTAKAMDVIDTNLLKIYREITGTAQNNIYDKTSVLNLAAQLQDFYAEYSKTLEDLRKTNDAKVILTLLRSWKEERYKALTAAERLHLLKVLSGVSLSDIQNPVAVFSAGFGGENTVLALLRYAPDAQAGALCTGLETTDNSKALVVALLDRMDNWGWGNDNRTSFFVTVNNLFQQTPRAVPVTDSSDIYYLSTYEKADLCISEGPMQTPFQSLADDGTLSLKQNYSYDSLCNGMGKGYILRASKSYKPFDAVGLVYYTYPSAAIVPPGKEGQQLVYPALFLKYHKEQWWNNVSLQFGKDVGQLAIASVGVGQVARAGTIWKIIAGLDLVVNSSDFAIRKPAIRSKILATDGGAQFLKYWDRAVLATNVLALSPVAGKWLYSGVREYKAWKQGKDLVAELGSDAATLETDMAKVESKLGEGIEGTSGGGDWLLWSQYTKKVINGEEFAVVGNKYYSKAAVEAAIPSQLGVPPSVVDEAISTGNNFTKVENGVTYRVFDKDNIRVVTESNGTIVRTISKVDFASMDIPYAMQHVKFRDLNNAVKRDIVGCHDQTKFFDQNIIKQVDATTNPTYQVAIGKNLSEVEEIIILKNVSHSKVPGVRVIEYRVPATTPQLKTTGALKGDGASNFTKTVYDPVIWPDFKLEAALKEALQDVSIKQHGIFTNGTKYIGSTKEGYQIEFWYRYNKIQTFYFK